MYKCKYNIKCLASLAAVSKCFAVLTNCIKLFGTPVPSTNACLSGMSKTGLHYTKIKALERALSALDLNGLRLL